MWIVVGVAGLLVVGATALVLWSVCVVAALSEEQAARQGSEDICPPTPGE